jgi:hypothetical protein
VTWAVVVVVLALAVASVVEIHAQSEGYRHQADQGYGALASRVVDLSNVTGSELAALLKQAPTIPNTPWASVAGGGARVRIQQGLDSAVGSAVLEWHQAEQIAPPGPAGDVEARLAAVLATRATTVSAVRATVDDLLGMAPLPVAGAPSSGSGSSTVAADGVGRISVAVATSQASAEGAAFERSARAYAVLAAQLRSGRLTGSGPIRLPASAWAPPGSPLSSSGLGGTPTLLTSVSAPALVAFHQLVITAVGLTPPAVPSSVPNDLPASGIVGVGCGSAASSATPGTTATVLPPTPTVAAEITVTNCGTVTEKAIPVTERLALSDPSGTAPPPAGDSGGTYRTQVTVASGRSAALTLGSLRVAGGHNYTLTISLVVAPPPAGQANLAGTSQEFLLKITG